MKKRIKNLTERYSFESGDYIATDNNEGTRKVDASEILNPIADLQNQVIENDDRYSSSKTYTPGDLVIAPDNLMIYRCTTTSSAGTWDTRKTNFERVSLVGAVDDLSHNDLGPSVDLTGQATYITPCDGYIQIQGGSQADTYTVIRIKSPTNNRNIRLFEYTPIAGKGSGTAIFVKKGMVLQLEAQMGGNALFYPLE